MRHFSFRSLPLRWKMTLAALTPLTIILTIVALSAAWIINAWVVEKAQQQVQNDLKAAREVFNHELSRIEDIVRFTANSDSMIELLANGSYDRLHNELHEIRQRERLDLFNFIPLAEHAPVQGLPTNIREPSLFFTDQAMQGKSFSGTVLLSAQEMALANPDIPQFALISLHPAGSQQQESRGMFLLNATPVLNREGATIGSLYGGVLLNNNLELIDRIHEVVYDTGTGSATIFLDHIRAATTIRLQNGDRAIGTSVSDEVAEAVLERGDTWLSRAYVVDDWYLTAYEPIKDANGTPIGALYVGLHEEPFSLLKQKASLLLLGLLAIGCGSGYLLAHYVASRIARPIVRLEDSTRRIAAGDRDITLPDADEDEIGRLTTSFKHMTEVLHQNEEELNRLNRGLEKKVLERTSELEDKSLELMRTQQELLRAEKLAAIGELASGVAHEINNPNAIIRGNIELLLAQLPPDHPGREEASEALKQTERVTRITQGMLTFAREQAITPERISVNKIITEVLSQVSHQEPIDHISIKTDLRSDVPTILADGERLRQVFTNLTLNALQALDDGGELKITSRPEGSGVEIRFEDNGPGIAADAKEKVFNPFFTTKPNGTGLGLSVSYGIINALKGTISVQSAPGEGTSFRIFLPIS